MPVLDAWSVGRSPVTLSSKVMGWHYPITGEPPAARAGFGAVPHGGRLSARSGRSLSWLDTTAICRTTASHDNINCLFRLSKLSYRQETNTI